MEGSGGEIKMRGEIQGETAKIKVHLRGSIET